MGTTNNTYNVDNEKKRERERKKKRLEKGGNKIAAKKLLLVGETRAEAEDE